MANAIRINASDAAGGIDMDSGTGGLIADSSGPISITSTLNAVNAINMDASGAASSLTIASGTGGIQLDTTGALSIDTTSATVASNITQTGAPGFDLSIASTAGSLNLTGGEAVANAIRIDASDAAGGIDMDSGTGGMAADSSGPISITSTLNAVNAIQLDASGAASSLTIDAGTGGIVFSTTGQTQLDGATFQAGAIAGLTGLTNADSGTWFSVDKTGGYAITLPTPPVAGVNYKFAVTVDAAAAVTISNGNAHLFGFIVNDVTSVIPATGTTLTIAAAGVVGDVVEIYGIDATHYLVKAYTSAAAGITVA